MNLDLYKQPLMQPDSAERPTLPSLLRTERILEFPAESNLGRLYIREWKDSRQYFASGYSDVTGFETDWRRLADAQGKVVIPAGFEVALKINRYFASDLSALAMLDPDAIQALILSGCPVRDEQLVHLLALRGLQGVDLSYTAITDTGLSTLSRLDNLRAIILNGVETISNSGIQQLQHCHALEVLGLMGCRSDGSALGYLRDLPSLHYLNISSFPFLSRNGLEQLGRLNSLVGLDLGALDIADEDFAYLQDLNNLQFLRFVGVTCTGKGFAYLKGMTELRELEFHMIWGFDSKELEHLCNVGKLQTVHLNMALVSVKGFEHLANIPGLRALYLASLYDANINGAMRHFTRAPSLEKLEFYDTPINNEGLAAIGRIVTLKSLDLDCDEGITDESIYYLSGLTNLKELRSCLSGGVYESS